MEKNGNGNLEIGNYSISKNGNRMVMEKNGNSGIVMRMEWKFFGWNGIRMEIRNYF
jgi:hypothetical protein